MASVGLEDFDEGFLRDVHLTDGFHPFFALLLLFQ